SQEGFVIERVRRDSIEARHVQRIDSTEVVVDPFGRETSFERVSYAQISFTIDSSLACLELRNGHRSLGACLSLLSEISGFRLTLKQLTSDVEDWARTLFSMSDEPMRTDAIQVGKI